MSQIYFLFCSNTLHVSDGLSVHHHEFKTVHTTTGIYQTDTADCLLASSQLYLFDICLLLYVQSWTHDDGRKDRPKHVECYCKIKNKFETLVHLVGFTIEIYYDARPYEREIQVVHSRQLDLDLCYLNLGRRGVWRRTPTIRGNTLALPSEFGL